jgi:hypothetical protein
LLAGSERSVEAFSFGGFAWALQFHLEADEAIIGSWIDHYCDELRELGLDPQRLRDETRRRAPSYRRDAIAFGRAFATLIHDVSRRRTATVR